MEGILSPAPATACLDSTGNNLDAEGSLPGFECCKEISGTFSESFLTSDKLASKEGLEGLTYPSFSIPDELLHDSESTAFSPIKVAVGFTFTCTVPEEADETKLCASRV